MDYCSWKSFLKFLNTILKSPVGWMMIACSLGEIGAGLLQKFLKDHYFAVILSKMVASYLQSAVAFFYILYKQLTLKNKKLSKKEFFMRSVHGVLFGLKLLVVVVDCVLLGVNNFAISVELSCINQLFETLYTIAFDKHEEDLKNVIRALKKEKQHLESYLAQMDQGILERDKIIAEKNCEILLLKRQLTLMKTA